MAAAASGSAENQKSIRKVAQRTEELAAANRELQEEILKEQSLAAENLKAYEEIAALKARLEIENTYLQDEIRTQF